MALRTVAEELARTRAAYLRVWLELEATKAVARIDLARRDVQFDQLSRRLRAVEARLDQLS